MQVAFSDPGPNRDRSGLQAIGFIPSISVQKHYTEYATIWLDVAQSDRRIILDWRKSIVVKKELDTIYQTAKELKAALMPEMELKMQIFLAELATLDERWRVLIESRKLN